MENPKETGWVSLFSFLWIYQRTLLFFCPRGGSLCSPIDFDLKALCDTVVSDCPSCFTLHFLETEEEKKKKAGICVYVILSSTQKLCGAGKSSTMRKQRVENGIASCHSWHVGINGWFRTHSDGFPRHPIELHSEVLKNISKYLSIFPYWELKLCRSRWGVHARASSVCFCELLFLLSNSITWN